MNLLFRAMARDCNNLTCQGIENGKLGEDISKIL